MHAGEILWTVVIGFLLVGSVGYFLSIYNSLVEVKNNIGRSWANIDVLLKQRHDELPKLVKVCEAYMQHERGTLTELTQLRSAFDRAKGSEEKVQVENRLSGTLGQLKVAVEAYPDLKANQSFLALQNRISDLENQIADRREFYNDVVTTFNTRIQQIPDMWVAQWMNLKPADWFRVTEEDREDVTVAFKMTG